MIEISFLFFIYMKLLRIFQSHSLDSFSIEINFIIFVQHMFALNTKSLLRIWPFQCWIVYKIYVYFLSSLWHRDDAGSGNPATWQRTCLSEIFNTMAADGLMTLGTRLSAVMVWTKFSQNIPISAPEELTINSLAPGKCGCNLKLVFFQVISRTDILGISLASAPRWMPWDLTDDNSTLVQVMAWCRQAIWHH